MAVLLNVGTLAEPTTKTSFNTGRALKPDGLFSHSDQQTLWQGTGPSSLLRSGWGGRIADRLNIVNGATPIPMAISVTSDSLYVTGNVTSAITVPYSGGFSLAGFNNNAADFARRTALDQLLAIDRETVLVKRVLTSSRARSQAARSSTPSSPQTQRRYKAFLPARKTPSQNSCCKQQSSSRCAPVSVRSGRFSSSH